MIAKEKRERKLRLENHLFSGERPGVWSASSENWTSIAVDHSSRSSSLKRREERQSCNSLPLLTYKSHRGHVANHRIRLKPSNSICAANPSAGCDHASYTLSLFRLSLLATMTTQLTEAEIWDDSALVRSWNDALAEYKV